MTAHAELSETGNKPIRTCVGCKARAAKSSLLRLVVAGSGIVPDPQARQPGRGAYLHPSPDCLELARRRRALPRALRASGSLDTDSLASYLSDAGAGRDYGGDAERSGQRRHPRQNRNLYGKQVEKL